MMSYIWPIALVVFSNVVYQICAKSVPKHMDVLASMTVTYLVGAVCSAILYGLLNKNGNLIQEYGKLNLAPILLGVSVVGLEVGFIYAYKAGWPVSTASIVQSAFLALALLFVGAPLYQEAVTARKVAGVVICLAGLYFISS
ncbi:MAG: EamA family transporter [Oscillibacter sp.]|nr:EamA family transporter [Oscillibacter sp.]